MGCNCGSGRRSAPRNFRKKTLKPSVGPTSIKGGTSSGPSPSQIRALGMQSVISNTTNPRRLDENRRELEKKRREAIRRRLNK